MKNSIIFFSIFFILLGCDKDDLSNVKFVDSSLPNSLIYQNPNRSDVEIITKIMDIVVVDEDGQEVYGKMKISFPDNDEEKLVSMSFTSNIFDETKLDRQFMMNYNNLNRSSCIASCQEKFTDSEGNKIKGRGACKAECWAKTAAAVGAAVAAIIMAFK